ncbi:MAG: cytochrome c3 family protein [Thermodesulfobacteriota bacterium]
MTLRTKTSLVLVAIVSMAAISSAHAQDKFRLKPGAKGKVCLECHDAFKEKMKQPFVHTPVKAGDCSDCHNPHTSDHGKLLAGNPNRICFSCHDGIVPANARSAHKVAVEGDCAKCHDPHASKNRNNLLAAGNQLCFGCHQDIAKRVAGAKFKHNPVDKGCLSCHSPHASASTPALLKTAVPGICVACHKPDVPAFGKAHAGYPVAKSDCSSCHDPHGSDSRGILWGKPHQPVANKMCGQCHPDASSPDALKTRKAGLDLCRGCHNDTMNEIQGKKRIHWPLVDKEACRNCHRPHASPEKALLKEPEKKLCAECHQDTMTQLARSANKHKPAADGKCTVCHRPHSSNLVFLLDNTSQINLCGTCHDWQKHSSHPIGEKAVDQRNRNLTMDCISCHAPHGSDQKRFAWYDVKMELCVQCHEQFKR